jgi:hypothetical protein
MTMTELRARLASQRKQIAMTKHPLMAAAVAAVILSGCTASVASSIPSLNASASTSRELTADEKDVIIEALADNIRDPAKAKYLWNPFPADAPANGQARYCAIVNAKSPHAPYNGMQPYLVQVQIANGKIVNAVVGAIAGGNDMRIVRNLCTKNGLNPDTAV